MLACSLLIRSGQRAEAKTSNFLALDADTIVDPTTKVHIRVLGLDAPETFAPHCKAERDLGYQAAGRMQHLLNANVVTVKPSGKLDKYGRTLAVVLVGKRNVADVLIAEGLARPYNGGKRQSWCPNGMARPALY
jgi:micrococcal nuclease